MSEALANLGLAVAIMVNKRLIFELSLENLGAVIEVLEASNKGTWGEIWLEEKLRRSQQHVGIIGSVEE